jgi:hypothetical protein
MASFSESTTFDNMYDSVFVLWKYFFYTKSTANDEKPEKDGYNVSLFGFFLIVIIIILSSVSGTLETYPDVIEKEKITPGYIEHLKGLIPGVGIPDGIIFSMWVVMAIKYSSA